MKNWTKKEDELLLSFLKNRKGETMKQLIHRIKDNFPERTFRGIELRCYTLMKKGQINSFKSNRDELIYKTIEQYPGNLQKAFSIVAEELNKTPNSIASYWYKKLKHQKQVFSTSSPVGGHSNCKNIHRGKEEKYEKFRVTINNIALNSYTISSPLFSF